MLVRRRAGFGTGEGEWMSDHADLIDGLRHGATRCQIGVPRYAGNYEELHALLAELYPVLHQAAEALEAMRWIPVSERLPDAHDMVLAAGLSPGTHEPWSGGDYAVDEDGKWYEVGSRVEDCSLLEITHWMPLPPAPEQGD